jgi:hypothetical protein
MSTSANRLIATVVGVAYLAIGAAGFLVSSSVGFFGTPGGLLLGIFEVNSLHNIVHIVIGVALLVAGVAGVRAAKTANSAIGAVCLLLGLGGLFVVGSPFNILAINGWDNVLHFGTSALLLAVGLGAERSARATA